MEDGERFADALRVEFILNCLLKRSVFPLKVETILFLEISGGKSFTVIFTNIFGNGPE